MGDVDRIKGIAEHLRQITQRQREIISSVGKMFSNLRYESTIDTLSSIATCTPSSLLVPLHHYL